MKRILFITLLASVAMTGSIRAEQVELDFEPIELEQEPPAPVELEPEQTGQLSAVELYPQDDLLEMLRANTHLERVQQDDCQLVDDIEARAEVLRLPAYQMLWADMLINGICVAEDIAVGFAYLETAAEQALPDALEQLGRYYLQGQFVVTDEAYGLRLIHAAASLGHHGALLNVAREYAQGKGSPLDYPDVYLWLHKAVFADNNQRNEAERLKNQLAQQLPPSLREQTRKASLAR